MMNILLAVDPSEYSEAAALLLIDRFKPDDVHVRILHAVEWFKEMPICFEFGQGPTYAREIEENRSHSFVRAGELVTRLAGQLSAAGFTTSVSTPDADPRHAIVSSAQDWPADLIVMGSHGRRGVDRFVLGSVAESVLRHATCSVLIARVATGT